MSKQQIIQSCIKRVIHHLDLDLFRNKKIFITGGTGFFGLWLLSALELLNEMGCGVQTTVLSRAPDKFLLNNAQWSNAEWLQFQKGDVKTFIFDNRQYDYLIHAATDTNADAHSDPIRIFEDTADGSKRVLDFAVQAKIQRVLLTSSGAVYGPQPSDLELIPDNSSIACPTNLATSAYGEGKRVMEFLASAYYQKYGLTPVTARCFAFVGPGLPIDQHFAIGNFIRDALYSNEIRVKGAGTAVRSYLFAGDLCVWLLKLLTQGEAAGIYNVGADNHLSMKTLATKVGQILAPEKQVIIEGNENADNSGRSRYVPSIERARLQHKLDAWTSLDDAIKITADFHLNT